MRVLFLTHRLPYAPNRGDRIRAFHLLHALTRHAAVDLVSLVHSAEEEAAASQLARVVDSVRTARVSPTRGAARAAIALAGDGSLTHALLDAPDVSRTIARVVDQSPPDVVLAYCSGMARFAVSPPLDRFPFVLDMVDVDSQKWDELGSSARWPLSWMYRREARLLGRFEIEAVRRAHATLVVNEREAATLAGMAPSERVLVVGNGVDVATFRPAASPSGEQRVIFCGVLDYRPNEDAVLWLIRDIWPPVRSAIPSARLTIVGANPTRAIARLAARDHSVDLEGAVPDVRPHLWKAAVSVAPLRTARGVQNKVLEAVAAGLPAVVTSAVAEGLPGAIRPACRVGSTASELSSELIDLLGRSAQARRALADSATLEGLTWDARLQPIGAILRDAADAAHHIANPPSIATETAMPARMAARRTARAR